MVKTVYRVERPEEYRIAGPTDLIELLPGSALAPSIPNIHCGPRFSRKYEKTLPYAQMFLNEGRQYFR